MNKIINAIKQRETIATKKYFCGFDLQGNYAIGFRLEEQRGHFWRPVIIKKYDFSHIFLTIKDGQIILNTHGVDLSSYDKKIIKEIQKLFK